MEQTRAETPARPGSAALRSDVTAQQPPEAMTERRTARAEDDLEARGEHVHSEPPAPQAAASPPPSQGPPPVPGPSGEAPSAPRRHSVRAQILTALREALLSGELVPGEVYSAPVLAERFGVSATPVREAMQRLVSEGVVETVPNRGFRVARCSARDLAELAEIRVLLEVPTVLRAAASLSSESWACLRPLAEETLTAAARGDRSAYADADRAFHCALLELTGNRQLVALAADIQRRSQCRPATSVPPPPAVCAAQMLGEAAEHVALLDALQARDLTAVERLLKAHVTE
jgi:DNA-binding GntR family transcriptional regulator